MRGNHGVTVATAVETVGETGATVGETVVVGTTKRRSQAVESGLNAKTMRMEEKSEKDSMPQWNQISAARLSFLDASLFSPGDLAQLVGQFFVNFSSVADREDPDAPGLAIDFINKAKASHLVFP